MLFRSENTNVNDVANGIYSSIEKVIYTNKLSGEDIAKNLTAHTGSELASIAALYAVAEGIALQQGKDSDEYKALHSADLKDPDSVIVAVSNIFASNDGKNAFDYIESGKHKNDINAYYEALNAVNNNQTQLESEIKNGGTVVDSDVVQNLLDQLIS